MPITLGEVKTAIILGELDNDLESIKVAIQTREGMKAGELKRSLNIGDTVYFKANIRPHYMAGAPAIVKAIRRTRVLVDLVKPAGRFNKNVTVPVDLVTTSKP